VGERLEDKVELIALPIDINLPVDEIENIGTTYISKNLSIKDEHDLPLPFCKTQDGLDVFFRGTAYHLLRRDKNEKYRVIDKTRVERIHWIIPIISGKCKRTIRWVDEMGDNLWKPFRPGVRYRIYWVPKRKHFIVLQYDKNNTALVLTTSFKVTEDWLRVNLATLFPKEIK
jgi:hypothetical protein